MVTDYDREFWDELVSDYGIDPALARLRREKNPLRFTHPPDGRPVLVIAEDGTKVHLTLWEEMMGKYDLSDYVRLTFMKRVPDYHMPAEKAASADYVRREIVHINPKVILALGNDAFKFVYRPGTKEGAPPVSVAHGKRFATPNGKPVIAGLPVMPYFHTKRIAAAFEATAWTLRNMTSEEFAPNG